jgi:hypothetical protein
MPWCPGWSAAERCERLAAALVHPGVDEAVKRTVSFAARMAGVARYFAPARVEIIDGPLKGRSFRSPTGAARAVLREYNPRVNDNRNGWGFWQIDNGGGPRVWLRSIRPAKAG